MLLANSDLISRPAQLYYSVLPFLPSDTYLARQYPTPRGCISVRTGRENCWPPSLFTLSGGTVTAFAPGGHLFAVGREDGIHIYNASNGLLNSSIRTTSSMDYTPYLATFTEAGCGVVVVSSECGVVNAFSSSDGKLSYQIEKFDLVKQNGQICRTTPRHDLYRLKLSEYGSYVAFADNEDRDTRICIWKTDDGEDIGIPSGGVRRTLYHEGAKYVHISHDGSFLASCADRDDARLWSVTQGTLLATFGTRWDCPVVFSRTNRLYVADYGVGRVYDASADPNSVTITSFPFISSLSYYPLLVLHANISILPTPDESRILIRTWDDIQVCSLKLTDYTRDTSHRDVIGIDLSGDASFLPLATLTDIEISVVRVGQHLHTIQNRARFLFHRRVAFSPNGELIVSLSEDGIIVVDVRAGVLLPTTYSFSPQGRDLTGSEMTTERIGISFDSSKLAARHSCADRASAVPTRYLCDSDRST